MREKSVSVRDRHSFGKNYLARFDAAQQSIVEAVELPIPPEKVEIEQHLIPLGFAQNKELLYTFPENFFDEVGDLGLRLSKQTIFETHQKQVREKSFKPIGLTKPFALSPNKQKLIFVKYGTGPLIFDLNSGQEEILFDFSLLPEGEGLPF